MVARVDTIADDNMNCSPSTRVSRHRRKSLPMMMSVMIMKSIVRAAPW